MTRAIESETQEVFDMLVEELPEDISNGSGIPQGYRWQSTFPNEAQCFKQAERVLMFPHVGGCVVLHRDGTWEGDAAPFAG